MMILVSWDDSRLFGHSNSPNCLNLYNNRQELDPTIVITHEMPLDEAAEAYKIFNDKNDGCVKVVLHTKFYEEDYSGKGEGSMERETSL